MRSQFSLHSDYPYLLKYGTEDQKQLPQMAKGNDYRHRDDRAELWR
jgi:hypothetical protein